ncbi:MAG: tRNA adenosine(34) deaminase TadA [Clostridiaceae bacterium]|nr:tRNA adenosine(34) deaminase TadA [Clostridiaceae bacterium]
MTGRLSADPNQPPDIQRRLYWMRLALRQADKALRLEEAPIGALVVQNGKIIGRGYNLRETRQDVVLHAEILAIRQACRKLKSWRLDGCDLYVTLEPCVMCAGAIVQARIHAVYYGAADPKGGACGSVADVFSLPLNHHVEVSGGWLAEDCSSLLSGFFRQRRRLDKAAGSRAQRRNQASLPK